MNTLDKIREKEIKENKNSGDVFDNFELICKKCGSKNIHISKERGRYYSEYTCDSDELNAKCKNCGTYDDLQL